MTKANTTTPTKQRQDWTLRLRLAALALEERNKTVEVVRVLYPEQTSVTVQIDGGLPRSFETVRQAAQFLETGLAWT